jgi:hypothetical protein
VLEVEPAELLRVPEVNRGKKCLRAALGICRRIGSRLLERQPRLTPGWWEAWFEICHCERAVWIVEGIAAQNLSPTLFKFLAVAFQAGQALRVVHVYAAGCGFEMVEFGMGGPTKRPHSRAHQCGDRGQHR